MMDRVIESAIVRGVFGHSDPSRRNFIRMVGGGTLAAALGTMIPMDKVKAAVKESFGPLEKSKLKVGFVPITCATPIIMAQPMGFYAKYGLDVDVIKTAGWAVARDKSLNGEYDASHMLTPMPLAMSMGAGSIATPYIMPAVENINGQAIGGAGLIDSSPALDFHGDVVAFQHLSELLQIVATRVGIYDKMIAAGLVPFRARLAGHQQ
jgi:nitrate/nitrite transport system substrate-binding protein